MRDGVQLYTVIYVPRDAAAGTIASPSSPSTLCSERQLAEVDACPDFASASPEVLKAIVYLADVIAAQKDGLKK